MYHKSQRPNRGVNKDGSDSAFSEMVLIIDEFQEPNSAVYSYRTYTWQYMNGEYVEVDFMWCYKPEWLVYR